MWSSSKHPLRAMLIRATMCFNLGYIYIPQIYELNIVLSVVFFIWWNMFTLVQVPSLTRVILFFWIMLFFQWYVT